MKKEYIIYKLSESIKSTSRIDNELFTKYNVKRGLRNEDHSGVLVGLTQIGDVVGYERLPEGLKAIPGRLLYRGIDVNDLVKGIHGENRFGFEEAAFLLLSGYLPNREELESFQSLIHAFMPLGQKTKMNILDLEGSNVMNILARCVLEMYTFDENPDDTSRDNLMRQSIDLISKFPTIIAYAYNIMRHSHGKTLHIRHPKEEYSIAENFLYMLKGEFSELEAKTLDRALVLHAEHGGGNKDVRAPQGEDAALGQGNRNRPVPEQDAAQRGLRPHRADLRHRPCGLYDFRPARTAAQGDGPGPGQREGA